MICINLGLIPTGLNTQAGVSRLCRETVLLRHTSTYGEGLLWVVSRR